MSNKTPLTLDEEFRFFTATLMNNWFALKLLIAHSEDSVQIRNQKVEGLLELLINCIQQIIYSNVELMDCIDNVEDYIDLKFNTYVEDNSCEEIINELVNYYNLLSCNKREELSSAIQHLKEKNSIFSNQEYNPDELPAKLRLVLANCHALSGGS
nr:uncharacterized protein LOC106677959 isoform X2 [Halyomorpha halys]